MFFISVGETCSPTVSFLNNTHSPTQTLASHYLREPGVFASGKEVSDY